MSIKMVRYMKTKWQEIQQQAFSCAERKQPCIHRDINQNQQILQRWFWLVTGELWWINTWKKFAKPSAVWWSHKYRHDGCQKFPALYKNELKEKAVSPPKDSTTLDL